MNTTPISKDNNSSTGDTTSQVSHLNITPKPKFDGAIRRNHLPKINKDITASTLEEVTEGKGIMQWKELSIQSQIILLFIAILILNRKHDQAILCINNVQGSFKDKQLLNANLLMFKGFSMFCRNEKDAKESFHCYTRAISLFKSVQKLGRPQDTNLGMAMCKYGLSILHFTHSD